MTPGARDAAANPDAAADPDAAANHHAVPDHEAVADGAAVPVLAAVVRRDGRYLLARRPDHKRHGGLWEFPGGKLEPGEGWLEAARRELSEELDVTVVAVGEPLFRRRDPGSRYEIVFVPVEIEGEPRAIEHAEVRWVAADALAELDLPPADATFAAGLR